LELVKADPVFYRESVLEAARTIEELQHTAASIGTRDMSLLLIRLDRSKVGAAEDRPLGVLSIQRTKEREIPENTREDLVTLATTAAAVIDRAHVPSSMKMAEWAYQESVSASGPMQQFLDNLEKLLGADLGRLVVLDEDRMWRSKLVTSDWPSGESRSTEFPSNDDSYLTVQAVSAPGGPAPRLAFDVQRPGLQPAHPPNSWVHGCVCVPLVSPRKPCRAAITLWHHTQGWFHAVGLGLLSLIGRFGGALYELTTVPEEVRHAVTEAERSIALEQAGRIVMQTFAAKAIVRSLKGGPEPYREAVRQLAEAVERIERVADYQESRREPVKTEQSLAELLDAAARALGTPKMPVVYRPNGDVRLAVDAEIVHEVLAAFVNASRELDDKAPVYFAIDARDGRECAVVVESVALNVRSEVARSLLDRGTSIRGRMVSLAGASSLMIRHQGRIELTGDAPTAFRLVLRDPKDGA